MDLLSMLCRLAASVPPPRRHTIRYSGVLAPASPWRLGSGICQRECAEKLAVVQEADPQHRESPA